MYITIELNINDNNLVRISSNRTVLNTVAKSVFSKHSDLEHFRIQYSGN